MQQAQGGYLRDVLYKHVVNINTHFDVNIVQNFPTLLTLKVFSEFKMQ